MDWYTCGARVILIQIASAISTDYPSRSGSCRNRKWLPCFAATREVDTEQPLDIPWLLSYKGALKFPPQISQLLKETAMSEHSRSPGVAPLHRVSLRTAIIVNSSNHTEQFR